MKSPSNSPRYTAVGSRGRGPELRFGSPTFSTRLLIAQAITELMQIVSADAAFDAYAVTRLW